MDHIYGINTALNHTMARAEFLRDSQAALELRVDRDSDVWDVRDVSTKVAAKRPTIERVMKHHELRVTILGHEKDMTADARFVANSPCLVDHDAYRTGVADHRLHVRCHSFRIPVNREHQSEVGSDGACLWVVLHTDRFDPPAICHAQVGIRDDG
jgi:hypothetical protein